MPRNPSAAKEFLASSLYRLLVAGESVRRVRPLRNLLDRMLRYGQRAFNETSVSTIIHGRRVAANFGFTYPLYMRRFPNLNSPLVELVYQVAAAKKRPVSVVDVGAAIGDTALLLEANCGALIRSMLCIEGDDEFYTYLEHNLKALPPNYHSCKALLSSEQGLIHSLVRTHAGTASAQGADNVSATTLDTLVADYPLSVDVLKTDVDGFDGRILLGASKLLTNSRPAIIFEWHPIVYRKTENDPLAPFHHLRSFDYVTFVWFTKYGEWAFTQKAPDDATISAMEEICHTTTSLPDWHYDIVALPADADISVRGLVDLENARHRISRY